ncbi:MAG TPA: hypothetical protein VD767_04070 [Thermomicrobiales bacterium]|nr:hypothetical protein [Thermomicrobiales bacterium]
MESTVTANPTPRLAVIVLPLRLGGNGLDLAYVANGPASGLISAAPLQDEPLDEAAVRLSQELVGRPPQYVEQLYTFDAQPGSSRQVIVSYLALFRHDTCEPPLKAGLQWSPVKEISLDSDVHRTVFDYALMRLKAKFGYTNIAFHLLPEQFTLSDLQQAYEQVLGHPVDKRNFRRRMSVSKVLVKTDALRRDGSHRPAALYRFVARDDQAAYLTPSWAAASLSPPNENDR